MDTRAERFPLFDSLRAIGCLGVIVGHCAAFGDMVSPEAAVKPYVDQIAVVLTLFFLVSGFLLYRPFVAARLDGRPRPSLRAYGWRRTLRLIPAYWVALTLITIWLGSSPHIVSEPKPTEVFSLEGIFLYYGFAQTYTIDSLSGGLPQAWTLNVEGLYYLLLPAFVAFMAWWTPRRTGKTTVGRELFAIGLLVLSTYVYIWIILAAGAGPGTGSLPFLTWLPGFIDHIALGMGLAVLSVATARRAGGPTRAERVIDRWPGATWLVALVAFWIVSTQVQGTPADPVTTADGLLRHALYAVAGVALVLPAVFGDPQRGLVRRLLANRALVHFGLVSYGVYVWHVAIIVQLDRWNWGDHVLVHPYLHWMVPVVLLAWLAGSISYYALERPVLSLKRLVPARPAQPDQPGAVSAPARPPAV
ncbi:MAG TPA: acyltransferase [Thermoleophilaceae bacterium]|nr:acyltransferase [Thermoleophilaceae bacterium]